MNATQKAQNAYRNTGQSVRTRRDLEYDAFARVTSRLKASNTKSTKGFKGLAEAIYENRRLWTILASDVASSDNGLPSDLRARIVYLSEFTRSHSTKVLRNEASVEPLIEINTAVMRGLRVAPASSQARGAQAMESVVQP